MDIIGILGQTASWLLAPETIAYALATVGLAVHFGYGGLLNFGQAGFMLIGGYGYAITILSLGWPWWAGILVGIGASIVFALILGIPTLRLRADYLAIATIAAAEALRLIVQSTLLDDVTNSADGLGGYHEGFRQANPFPKGSYGFGPWTYNETELWIRVFGLVILGLAIWAVWALMRSPWGRVVRGIREDEDAVRALGKNVFAYKMQSLVIGGALGALAGIYFVSQQASVVPSNYSTAQTFYAYVCLILGGTARIWGPVVGSMLFWAIVTFTNETLRQAVAQDLIPQSLMDPNQVGQVRLMLVGAGLILLLVFRPQGLLGDRRELILEPS